MHSAICDAVNSLHLERRETLTTTGAISTRVNSSNIFNHYIRARIPLGQGQRSRIKRARYVFITGSLPQVWQTLRPPKISVANHCLVEQSFTYKWLFTSPSDQEVAKNSIVGLARYSYSELPVVGTVSKLPLSWSNAPVQIIAILGDRFACHSVGYKILNHFTEDLRHS